MLKKRLVPCLFLKNGFLVRSEQFQTHQLLGNAIHQVERFNAWDVDELIYIDITADHDVENGRDDLKIKSESDGLKLLETISKTCFMPLTFGGGIRTMQDIQERISRGADKITLNSSVLENPELISQSAKYFGSQAIVVSMDVKCHGNLRYEVFANHGRRPTGKNPVDWAREVERLGAGEIFLNSIDRDGMACGYDLTLVRQVSDAVRMPVIACGGVGKFSHFAEGIIEGHADAVAAGNIFHFTELSAKQARKALVKMNVDVRH
jgi:imidazole glycerol-phosphate synthase subunit HisF